MIAEPIKMIFLFLGWLPPFFLNMAMMIEEHINGLEKLDYNRSDEFVDGDLCKTTNDDKESEWFCFKAYSGSNYTKVPFKHMEAMCFLPTCISQFGTVGTCIFIMLISIVRYVSN